MGASLGPLARLASRVIPKLEDEDDPWQAGISGPPAPATFPETLAGARGPRAPTRPQGPGRGSNEQVDGVLATVAGISLTPGEP